MRALFFDFDGTLHDMATAHTRALEAGVAPRCGPGVTIGEVRRRTDAVWARLWPGYLTGEVSEDALYDEWYAEMDRAAGAAVRQAYAQAFDAALTLFPEVLPALDAARPLRLAILTNGAARHQRTRIATVGLAKRIPVQVISGESPMPPVGRRHAG
jgi:FMN phosphatase YigB (HAD superfamily)